MDAAQLQRLKSALAAMRDGNFRRRLTVTGDGVMAEVAALFNEVADRNLHLTGELSRVRRTVGREENSRSGWRRGSARARGPRRSRRPTPSSTTWSTPSPRSAGYSPRSPTVTWSSGWSCGRRRRTVRGIHCAGSS
ncbi:hypothetical protein ACFQVA_32210 [Actinomadura keratinilytica]